MGKELEKSLDGLIKGVLSKINITSISEKHKTTWNTSQLSDRAKAKLTAMLAYEYDFYDYVKQRLLQQASEL